MIELEIWQIGDWLGYRELGNEGKKQKEMSVQIAEEQLEIDE